MKEYYQNPAMSQSYLKCFDNYYDVIKERNDDKLIDSAFILGSAVDCLITEPDEFSNRFYIGSEPKVLPQEKILVEEFVKRHPDKFILDGDLISLSLELDLFKSVKKLEKREEKTSTTSIISYWNFLKNSESKYYLHPEDNIKANELVQIFKTSYTAPFFKGITDYQIPLYGEILGVKAKGLADAMIKTEEDTTLDWLFLPEKSILPLDLKVTSFSNPLAAIRKFKYQIQARWYKELFIQNYSEYKIMNPIFLFANPKWDYSLWYQFTDKDMEFAMKGGSRVNGKIVNDKEPTNWGIVQYIEEYKKYEMYGYDEYYKNKINKGRIENAWKYD